MRARFWRNVTLVALAHVAALFALLRWAGETKAASAPQITWLSGGAESAAEEEESQPEPVTNASTPESMSPPLAAKSEIVLPSATPTPTPVPSVTPRPTPKKLSAKPTSMPTPRKKAPPKASATPVRKKAEGTVKKKPEGSKRNSAKEAAPGNAKTSTAGSGDGANGTGSGNSDAATVNYYGNMLHDRFYRAWQQPQTVVASGVKLSAVARIRIEKDGRVSNFKVVKPSGNVLVDESVQAAGKKVTQVDALPAGMGSGGHYDVNISFALNSQ
jgi:periplasmic protein TonB